MLWCGAARGALPTYHVTDLGTLGGHTSVAEGINSLGQVVGYSFSATDGSNARAFVYTNGAMTDLGQPYGGYTYAGAVNAAGQIIGVGDATHTSHAFVYQNGSFTDLGAVGFRGVGGINASGQIGGTAANHAAIYDHGVVTDLGALGDAASSAGGIDSFGNVVGNSQTGSVDSKGTAILHAFRYSSGVMSDLGSLGGTTTGANAISSDGATIVGSGQIGDSFSPEHAFVYRNGSMTDVGTFGGSNSAAYGVNSAGQFVGYAEYPGATRHAFEFTTQMFDLNQSLDASGSGWTLSVATAINDHGWITGYGTNSSGFTHAFLLTPMPEPSSLAFFSVSLGMFAGRRQRRQIEK